MATSNEALDLGHICRFLAELAEAAAPCVDLLPCEEGDDWLAFRRFLQTLAALDLEGLRAAPMREGSHLPH